MSTCLPHSCPVVVDNLPKVSEEKYAKLEGYVKKVYSQIGSINSEGGFYMPVDEETKVTKGYAFVEFSNPQASLESPSTEA